MVQVCNGAQGRPAYDNLAVAPCVRPHLHDAALGFSEISFAVLREDGGHRLACSLLHQRIAVEEMVPAPPTPHHSHSRS